MANSFQTKLKENEKIIGTVGAILAVIMFMSLVEVFISNLNNQSSIIIQPVATAVNGVVWSLYAYGRQDWFLFGPNVLACVLGVLTAGAALV